VKILAVDPGGTTGWMTWDSELGRMGWGMSNFEEFVSFVNVAASPHQIDVIVCERYTITANTLRKSRQHEALEVIGFLRAVAHLRGIKFELQQQNPPFSTDARLRLCSLYVPNDHARSAARQLLLYLVKHEINPGASAEELANA
jgi:hypothetical protein